MLFLNGIAWRPRQVRKGKNEERLRNNPPGPQASSVLVFRDVNSLNQARWKPVDRADCSVISLHYIATIFLSTGIFKAPPSLPVIFPEQTFPIPAEMHQVPDIDREV